MTVDKYIKSLFEQSLVVDVPVANNVFEAIKKKFSPSSLAPFKFIDLQISLEDLEKLLFSNFTMKKEKVINGKSDKTASTEFCRSFFSQSDEFKLHVHLPRNRSIESYTNNCIERIIKQNIEDEDKKYAELLKDFFGGFQTKTISSKKSFAELVKFIILRYNKISKSEKPFETVQEQISNYKNKIYISFGTGFGMPGMENDIILHYLNKFAAKSHTLHYCESEELCFREFIKRAQKEFGELMKDPSDYFISKESLSKLVDGCANGSPRDLTMEELIPFLPENAEFKFDAEKKSKEILDNYDKFVMKKYIEVFHRKISYSGKESFLKYFGSRKLWLNSTVFACLKKNQKILKGVLHHNKIQQENPTKKPPQSHSKQGPQL